jgi:glycosyltransferase involved in cell wall biosynthesis
MPALSVVIITFNEEKNIARCLDSVKDLADEIVVVDSHSTDRTASICEKYKVKFVRHDWQGYSATKNFANAQAKNDWILSLDADEALSPELKRSMLELKPGTAMITCGFNRLTNYCGQWVKHGGWYPDAKVRLFDRRITQWVGTIHERLVFSTPQKILHLEGDCLHYSYYTREDHYKQLEKFTGMAAQDLYERGKRPDPVRQFLGPVAGFISNYFLKLGFLDGGAGFAIARISAYGTYLKYKKLRALRKNGK